MKKIFSVRNYPIPVNVALLLLRLGCGYAFVLHGWGKIQNPFHWMGDSPTPAIFQFLAALSEFGGGLAWMLGLLTPLASFGIACTMIVATYMHCCVLGDPFVNPKGGGSYELALVYFLVAFLVMMAGPGRYSLDRRIFGS